MSDLLKLDNIAESDGADSNAFAVLEKRLKKVEQGRKEDRFIFVFVIILIFDAILFMYLIDGLAALTLGLMEFILLLVIADKYDIKYFEIIFKRVTGMLKNNDKD